MIFPRVKVKFSERIKAVRWFNIIFFIIVARSVIDGLDVISILLLLIGIPEILYLIDMVFGLYTKTIGVCTGIAR